MKINANFLKYAIIARKINIELNNGKEIEITKSTRNNDYEYEEDWKCDDEKSQKIYDNLSEEEKDNVDDFITKININKLKEIL